MKLCIVAGARPNFMKIAPIVRAIEKANHKNNVIDYEIVHTGQHFDDSMSGVFFKQLGIPEPTINLQAGGGTQAEQTAAIMTRFESYLLDAQPTVVLVVGDVTSTMACAITSKKMQIAVVHVEAGIRSGDLRMPEEINRIVTDALCDHFYTTSASAGNNLLAHGATEDQIHFVGNTMIDTLLYSLDQTFAPQIWEDESLEPQNYFLLTLHRPSNVDDANNLTHILDTVSRYADDGKLVFPVHPRTKKVLDASGYHNDALVQTTPMSYLEFIYLARHAKGIITDSGGITEEATVLNVPCMTLRDSTERPETVELGTNVLVGTDPDDLVPFLERLKNDAWKQSTTPPLWDGKTSERIVESLVELYS